MRRRSVVLCAALFGLACTPADDVPPTGQEAGPEAGLDELSAAPEVTRTPVTCTPPKPTVQGVADSAGGWLGEPDDHVRLQYPAGAFADGVPLTLIVHPQNHGVRLAQEASDATLTGELRFQLQLPDCVYEGGDYYFLHDNTETPVDSVYEDDAWWARGEIPLAARPIQQDTSAAQRPTGFVILSN